MASTRLISEESSYGFLGNIPHIIRDCFRYSLFFSLLSVLILLFFTSYISDVILGNTISIYLLYILAIALPICSLSSCLNGYFMAVKKIGIIVVSQVLEVLVQIIVVFIFYALNIFTTTNSICLGLILGLIISDICSFLYLIYEYFIDYKKYKNSTHNKCNFRKQICKISLPVAFTTYIKSGLSTLKNSLIPIAFVSYGLSYDQSLSYYGLISGTVMTLLLFPFTFIQSYSSLLIPELSTYNIKSDSKKIIRITKKSLSLTFVFSILIVIVLVLFSHWIDEYLYKSLSIEFYIKLLAPIIIYIYMDNVIDSLLKSLDLQVYVMIINIVDLIISILFIKFLIPSFGINGYIFILYFSEIFNFFVSLFILRRKIGR
ncbi:MAG: polysaccharide biosynthesis C-terminal domain-containing protein [Clostridia bacterium]|nr:polysaccharide biosynthesis C-terminal domain-containing protein [Clostridia bacterium]